MPGRGVEDRGEHDGERPDDGQRRRPPARRPRRRRRRRGRGRRRRSGAAPMRSCGQELEPDQQREDRHRRLGDPGRRPSRCAARPRRRARTGAAALRNPSTIASRQASRSRATARARADRRHRGSASRTTPAISVRAAISAPGEKPPSTPTLMKRYDAPQSGGERRGSAASTCWSRLEASRPRRGRGPWRARCRRGRARGRRAPSR